MKAFSWLRERRNVGERLMNAVASAKLTQEARWLHELQERLLAHIDDEQIAAWVATVDQFWNKTPGTCDSNAVWPQSEAFEKLSEVSQLLVEGARYESTL